MSEFLWYGTTLFLMSMVLPPFLMSIIQPIFWPPVSMLYIC